MALRTFSAVTSYGLVFIFGLMPSETAEARAAARAGELLTWHAGLMERRVRNLYEARL